MRRLAAALAAVVLALLAMPAAAQEGPVVARSAVDRQAMTIGDQVLFTVTVDLARGFDLMDPGVPRAIGDFEVVDTLTVLQSRLPSGTTRVTLRYLVTTFELGQKRIPVVVVGYRGADGALGQARTQGGHVITVRTVIQPGEDLADIKPLKPPLRVSGSDDVLRRVLPVAGTAVALVAAAILALRIRRRPGLVIDAVAQAPARAALAELERITELRLPEQGRTREHYDQVSAALRRFIGQRYGVAAEARTARELRRELERAGLDRARAQLFCETLADAESVRYEDRLIFPARARKTMSELIDVMRRSVVAEEYELVSSGAMA